jgi:exonuclease III
MSNRSQRLLLHIASLNCHSLVKSNNPKKQSQFIRYLRSLKFDIMTLQETHVSDNTLSIINTQFQARYSMWTRHCGIVSFSPSFILSDNLVPENDRIILTKVKHSYNAFASF